MHDDGLAPIVVLVVAIIDMYVCVCIDHVLCCMVFIAINREGSKSL